MLTLKRRLTAFVFVMLVVEFMDEFAYSALEAARPLIRDTFALSYVQLGLITTVPVLVAIALEPVAGLYADTRHRRSLIVWGGLFFGIGLLVQGLSPTFLGFMIGATMQAPGSGVFVNLAQASLMDDAPARREHRMALWTFSGSLAVVAGPLLLSAIVALGGDWRAFFVGAGLLSILVALAITRMPQRPRDDAPSLRERFGGVVALLRRRDVWGWLVLLQASDLMLDVMFGLLALYLVDVVGVSTATAGVAVATWTGVGLLGDFLLIPVLERVRGLDYLRLSAATTLVLYPLFLWVDPWPAKLVLLGLIGLFNAGWYAILQGKLYDALGEQSGAVLIVGNAAGIVGALLPVTLGAVAQIFGLEAAMWVLLAGPVVLLIGLLRRT